MRARRTAIASLALFALGAGACSLVEGLDKLQKVGDVPGDDGGPSPDGGTAFCAARAGALFCDDFDQRGLPGGWSAFHQSGGTLVLDEGASTSPPRSLLETLAPLDAGTIDVSLRTGPIPLPALPATVRFELAFDPVQVDPTPNAAALVASLDFDDPAQNRYSVILTLFPVNDVLTLSLGEQTGLVDGGAAYTPHTVPNPIAPGAWNHLALDVAFTDGATATAQLTIDGVSAFSPAIAIHPTIAGLTQMLAGIGATYETVPTPGWVFRYDDVAVEKL